MVFNSYCYPMIESVNRWQLSPTPKHFQSLPPYHLPTKLQNQKAHSTVIDWVTISSLRDALITHYDFSPQLDAIFVDLMEYSVVELEDISSVFAGVEKGRGYLGIWNIFHAIENNARKASLAPDQSSHLHIPPELTQNRGFGLLQMFQMPLVSDVKQTCRSACPLNGDWTPITPIELFSSPIMAQKLYYHLELYRADKWWRIDPAFFEKYPLLRWEGYQSSVASGSRFRFDSYSPPRNVVWSFEQMIGEYRRTLNSLQTVSGQC